MSLFKPNIEKLKRKKDIGGLSKALQNRDSIICQNAAQALGGIKDNKVIYPLLMAIDRNDLEVQVAALKALGNIRFSTEKESAKIINAIVGTLTLNDENIQAAALRSLKKLTAPLIVTLKNMDKGSRQKTIDIIAKRRNNVEVDILLSTYEELVDLYLTKWLRLKHQLNLNEIEDLQLLLLENLGETENPKVIEQIIETFKDKNISSCLRRKVIAALVKIGEPTSQFIIQFLASEEPEIRSQAVQILDEIGWTPANDGEKVYYHLAAETIEGTLLESLILALKDGNSIIRRGAASALGELGDIQAFDPIHKTISDKDKSVREAAVTAIGKIGGTNAVESIIQVLSDSNNQVRKAAVCALAKIGGKSVVESLIRSLKDKCSSVGIVAVEGLMHIRDSRAIDPLCSALRGDLEVHFNSKYIIESLAELGDKRAASQVIDHLFKNPLRHNEAILVSDNLFEGYTKFIIDAVSYYSKHFSSYYINTEAVLELCKINTTISSNILHKVANRQDIEVTIHTSDVCGGRYQSNLSFDPQRIIAINELNKRKNPSYDRSAYLVEEAWSMNKYTE